MNTTLGPDALVAPGPVPSPLTQPPAGPQVMDPIPHTVREFGVEARKHGRAWEAAFNGPIQSWADPHTGQALYAVTVRLSRLKDPLTRELYSTNLLFYLPAARMHGMHNVYDMVKAFPFTRIHAPRTPLPRCPPQPGRVGYAANPEGVIMEDLRLVPLALPDGGAGFFVTGQGYRGKVLFPDGQVVHDVGVYGGYLDPQQRPRRLELRHLFGGVEFGGQPTGTAEDALLTELAEGVWVRGIAGAEADRPHVESYKNSVRLPGGPERTVLIGARSMSETKRLAYFESASADGLSGYRLGGVIDGLHQALGVELWDRVHRVGLGSNFVECPELGGHIGFLHVVLERNNPHRPDTLDPSHPQVVEQYEGWVAWLGVDAGGQPVIRSCVRAITPDDVPPVYGGSGEMFRDKRVAFPVSVYRSGSTLQVGYGWGDRALFQAEFDYETVTRQLGRGAWAAGGGAAGDGASGDR